MIHTRYLIKQQNLEVEATSVRQKRDAMTNTYPSNAINTGYGSCSCQSVNKNI